MSIEQFGDLIKSKYPDYASQDSAALGRTVLAKHPEYSSRVNIVAGAGPAGVPSLPAHPAADLSAPGLVDKLTGSANDALANTPGQPVRNVGRRAARDLISTAGTLASPGKLASGVLQNEAAMANGTYRPPNAVTPYIDTYHRQGLTQALTDAGGDALAGLAMGKLAEAAPDAAASTLNAAGRATKSAGALSSRIAIGAPAAEDALGADAGRALSSNRIVGIKPQSLARRVESTIGPASEARDAILARSTAPATNVTPDVTSPFEEISAAKTDPRTGAARPEAIRRLTTARRAITDVADPATGQATATPKDPNLSPLEMSQLQRNMYGMTDYDSADSDLANQALKGASANLRSRINQVAPEASTMTDSLHDLMGAKETLRGKTSGEIPTSKSGLVLSLMRAGRMGIGTGAGALLDTAGSGLMRLGGAMRGASPMGSPVAPSTPGAAASASLAPNRPLLPGGPSGEPVTTDWADIPREGVALPGKLAGRLSSSPVAPGLPAAASEGYAAQPASPPPEFNPATARNRTAPTGPAPRPVPSPARTIDVAPGGGATVRRPLLESVTGRRAPSQMVSRQSLLSRLRPASADALSPAPASVEQAPPPTPVRASGGGGRLPDPTDIDGWEKLVDDGLARYNTKSHQYEYLGGKR